MVCCSVSVPERYLRYFFPAMSLSFYIHSNFMKCRNVLLRSLLQIASSWYGRAEEDEQGLV